MKPQDPQSRSQRILHYVANCKKPATLHAIATAVADCETAANFTAQIAAQLHQLTTAKKLKRTGAPRAYLYSATPRTLVDGRKFDSKGKLRDKTRNKPVAPARSRTPAPKPTAATRGAAKPAPAQRIAVTRTSTRPPRFTGERETVAEFLARGGRIQKLKHGECSSPLFESVRALNDKTMRKRLAEADNDPDTDLDDADDIAAIAHA